jgi:hypothetical protein
MSVGTGHQLAWRMIRIPMFNIEIDGIGISHGHPKTMAEDRRKTNRHAEHTKAQPYVQSEAINAVPSVRRPR